MQPVFIQAFIGGLLIGTGAILLMIFNGRIAGISGITAGAFGDQGRERLWRVAFIVGLIIAPILCAPLGFTLPEAIPGSLALLAVAGVLVGLGTRIGAGCTSGHGICGIGRLSKRSITATVTFMASAIITVMIVRHGW